MQTDDHRLQLVRWLLLEALEQCAAMRGEELDDADRLTGEDLVRGILDAFRARGFDVDNGRAVDAARNAAVPAMTELAMLRDELANVGGA